MAGHLVVRDEPAALAGIVAERIAEWPALGLLREVGAGRLDHPAVISSTTCDACTDWWRRGAGAGAPASPR